MEQPTPTKADLLKVLNGPNIDARLKLLLIPLLSMVTDQMVGLWYGLILEGKTILESTDRGKEYLGRVFAALSKK